MIVTLICLFTASAPAQAGDGYRLNWSTVDGGGGTSTGDGFRLRGTIGQADPDVLTADGYVLLGGFWAPSPHTPTLPVEAKHHARKHRYLSIDPSTNARSEVAFKVEIAAMRRCENDPRRACNEDLDCRAVCEDDPNTLCPTGPGVCGGGACINSGPCIDVTPDPPVSWLVQEPQQICAGCLANGCVSQCDPKLPDYVNCCGDDDWVARLSDTVYSQDWSEQSLIHIGDCGIVPGVTYNVYACYPGEVMICGSPLVVATQRTPSGTHLHFGDIAGPPVNAGDPYEPPDGFVNVVDVSAWGLTKQNYGTPATPQLHPTMADLHGPGYGIPPNYILGLSDQQAIINHGFTWALPWDNPAGLQGVDPSTCPGRLP